MRRPSALFALIFVVAACTTRHVAAPVPAADVRQSVVLISLDGFRWDYINRPEASNLRALAAHGVRAERLVPSFPSLTFPNHYTIATGLYPEHHGIVSNAMVDPVLGRFGIGDNPAVRDARWWGGQPIWVTAELQHERAAPISWPGAEAPIGGIRPTWWEKFDPKLSRADRVRKVLALLALPADSAPRLVTQYFAEVDHEGHFSGPDAPQTDTAIAQLDSAVGAIVDGIAKMGLSGRVNIIVLADHGMAALSKSRLIVLDDYVSLDSLDIIEGGPVEEIAPKPGHERYVYDRLHGANPHLAVYRKGELPARFHYNDNSRIPPIIAIADEGWITTTQSRVRANAGPMGGNHGYDNQLLSMGALFVASGPAFKSGVIVPPFQNIHVYDLIAHLLGLRPAPNDGSLDSTRAMLKTRAASSP
jgi:predicted AlkP superfamily pyrophosphatase or phosphodiesterase